MVEDVMQYAIVKNTVNRGLLVASYHHCTKYAEDTKSVTALMSTA